MPKFLIHSNNINNPLKVCIYIREEINKVSLTLQKLPVFYQLLLSEIDNKNQDKINNKINQFTIVQSKDNQEGIYYTHPVKEGFFTGISALAHVLLDLRSEDDYFRSKPISRYLTFKFSLQLDLINAWHNIKVNEYEQDFYLYFTALSLMDEKKYQQSITTLEETFLHYSIIGWLDFIIYPDEPFIR